MGEIAGPVDGLERVGVEDSVLPLVADAAQMIDVQHGYSEAING